MSNRKEIVLTVTEGEQLMQVKSSSDTLELSQGSTERFHEFAHVLLKVFKAYQSDVDLSEWFSSSLITDHSLIVKCQWTPDGRLTLIEEPAKKNYLHAMTPDECMKRRRNFTCPKSVYKITPKVKEPGKGKKDGDK